jgi:hypothetical protein
MRSARVTLPGSFSWVGFVISDDCEENQIDEIIYEEGNFASRDDIEKREDFADDPKKIEAPSNSSRVTFLPRIVSLRNGAHCEGHRSDPAYDFHYEFHTLIFSRGPGPVKARE